MTTFQERLANERRRLMEGPSAEEAPAGVGTVRFIAFCPGNAQEVLERTKSVLKLMNDAGTRQWPTDDCWRHWLPEWFVARCRPELTVEEAEAEMARRNRLPAEEQKRAAEERWSLLNWVYWFEPNNRQWYWWDGVVLDPNHLAVAIEVDAWPFPWGSLSWLLRASGAEKVEAEP